MDTLPTFTSQPAEYQGRFDNLVLVQPPQPERGLPLRRILDIIGLPYSYHVLTMRDWRGDKGRFETPVVPYATWLGDGDRNLRVSVSVVRDSLPEDARGGTGLDGVFLFVAGRGVLRRGYFPEFPGSEVGTIYVPSLHLGNDGLELGCRYFDYPHLSYGSVDAGRKIVLGKLAA